MTVRTHSELITRIEQLLARLPDHSLLLLTQEQEDDVSSCYLLASAELEHFLEQHVSELMSRTIIAFKKSGVVSPPLLSLHHRFHPASAKEKIDKIMAEFNTLYTDSIDSAHASFRQCIKDNHGFREDKMGKLLVACSIDPGDFTTQLTQLISFSRKRGDFAHQASTPKNVTLSPTAEADIRAALQAALDIYNKIDAVKIRQAKLGI